MKIELFFTPGCERCAANRSSLKTAAEQTAGAIEWREININEDVEYAVKLGVLSAPALAIDGELAFSSLPTEKQLRAELQRRRVKGA